MGKRGVTRLGYEAGRDIEFVRRLREAVGPDAWIMLDRGVSLTWDLEHAIRLIRTFEEYGLRWIEEPFEPHEIINYQKLRSAVDTMIAWGEREWGRARLPAGDIHRDGRCGGMRPRSLRRHHRRPADHQPGGGGGSVVQRPCLEQRGGDRGQPGSFVHHRPLSALRAQTY